MNKVVLFVLMTVLFVTACTNNAAWIYHIQQTTQVKWRQIIIISISSISVQLMIMAIKLLKTYLSNIAQTVAKR